MVWSPTIIGNAKCIDFQALTKSYSRILLAVMEFMLERHRQHPEYRFFDTKIDTITGASFASEDSFRGKKIIYGWIQGRGLEAVAGHIKWLQTTQDSNRRALAEQLTVMLRDILENLEELRAKNRGRMTFMFSPDGTPLTIANDGEIVQAEIPANSSNFSDLFYAKGLFAAATELKIPSLAASAEKLFGDILDDISNNRFLNDQQQFDPKNRVRPLPGKHPQGPWMIALGGIALFAAGAKDEDSKQKWLDYGQMFIRHILDTHLNTGQHRDLELYDFIESVDNQGAPWREEDGAILSDTGHALEFIGLAQKVLCEIRKSAPLLEECRNLLPVVLQHNFHLSFNREIGGICKSFDLLSRKPYNSDMPWWSLPETIRAATLTLKTSPATAAHSAILEIITQCSNAFMKTFVNPRAHLMAYQTVKATGRPLRTIPATPDADPGYHTGLSIIDAMHEWRSLY